MSASPAALPAPNTDLIANVFDVLPLPAFVVDRDFNIIDFNLAGARLLDQVPFAVLRLRRGNQVQCVHSIDTEGDAATEACPECIGKNFLREVFGQANGLRNTGRLRLIRNGKTADVDFLITVAPIPDESEPLALVILEDAAELAALLESKDRSATPASSSPGSKARAKARGRKTGSS
ncbi:MAG: PAS domain-containing protein [Bryobacteraceae bacterium]|jgi:PAS domain-containing protein